MRKRKKQEIQELFNFFDKIEGKASKEYLMPKPDFAQILGKLSEPQKAIYESTQQVNLFLAGQGAGKTYIGGAKYAYFIDNFPEVRGMIAANTYAQLTQSTLFRMREFWKTECNWKEYNEYSQEGEYVIGKQPPAHFNTENHNYDKYHNIISFKNGAVIYYGSLDNYKALDGKEVGWAILDETKDTKEEAVKEVILGRLRQKGILVDGKDFNPLYLLTSPAKVQWINEWFSLDDFESEIMMLIFSETEFFQKEVQNKKAVISSTYHNQENLPEDYIPNQKINLSTALQDMLIYGSPFSKSGGEFYKGFDRAIHVKECDYNRDIPLHIGFDFNVIPYITLVISQVDGNTIYFINEICLESPRNSTEKLCHEFKREYPHHTAGLFVKGDVSGKTRNTRSSNNRNDYTIIKNELEKYHPQVRVPKSNPYIVTRGNFINQVFEKELYDTKIIISPKCKKLINDLSFIKEAPDGTKYKKKVTKNKVTYEELGHPSDAMDYIMIETFKQVYQKYLRGGSPKRKWKLGSFRKSNKY